MKHDGFPSRQASRTNLHSSLSLLRLHFKQRLRGCFDIIGFYILLCLFFACMPSTWLMSTGQRAQQRELKSHARFLSGNL